MPYIKSGDGRREALQQGEPALLAGELNYQIFFHFKHYYVNLPMEEIKKFVDNFLGEKPNYQRYNDMTGALIRCYIELKRRLNIDAEELINLCADYDDEIAKYEDLKCKKNGDVE